MEIIAENLSLQVSKIKILHDIDLKIAKGKISVIIGKNGSGKSSLMKTMARILKQTSGNIIIDGKNIADFTQKSLAKKVSFLAQSQDIMHSFTVRDIVALGRFPHQSLTCKETDEDKRMIDWALQITHLKNKTCEYIKNLSGGERQKVFIAMNLAQGSDYIFLDEPTTYLDIHNQIELLTLIKKLNKEQHKTIVMILHDINQAFKYADWIFIVKEGKIYFQGHPQKISHEKMLCDVFDVKAKIYKSDEGNIIFYPEENMNEIQEDLKIESAFNNFMSIEKKFLIACIREKILKNYEINKQSIMCVKLDADYMLKFKVYSFKTCARFFIVSDIFLYCKNVFLKKLDEDNFFPFIKNYISKDEFSLIKNENMFIELNESVCNLKTFRNLAFKSNEFKSSLDYVTKTKASFKNFSPTAFYEQSVIEAHPTHPNAKTRLGFSDSDLLKYSPECRTIVQLKVCAIQRDHMLELSMDENSVSDFILNYNEDISNKIKNELHTLNINLQNYGLILIHPWQFDNTLKKDYLALIEDKILIKLSTSIPSSPLISLRSLALTEMNPSTPRFHVKMALSVLTTGDIRILTARAVERGIEISKIIATIGKNINKKYSTQFYILKERRGTSLTLPSYSPIRDNDEYPHRISDRFSFLLRENPEDFISEDEIVLPGAALIEKSPFSDKKIIEELIDKTAGVLCFFTKYVSTVVPGFLIYLAKYGLSLEGHLQNTLIAFKNGMPTKVFVRDLSYISISQKRLSNQKISCELNTKNAAILSENLGVLHANILYSFLQGHIAEIIIQLSYIYKIDEDKLWKIVRKCVEDTYEILALEIDLKEFINEDKQALLFSERIKFKLLLKMRLQNEIIENKYDFIENPIYTQVT